ncbi:unnamed protein product [Lymnaea stagnalis]|uniref:Uncharacterized protein n=1 Tax=Lymnaea stagnalis TaxID=6523 RepID=A0AAV2HWD8_LYMST
MKDLLIVLIVVFWFSPALTVCPSGWARRGSSCYYIFPEKLNRSEAGNVCAAHSSTLLSFKDEAEWNFLTSLVQAANLDADSWTNLVYTSGVWTWEDMTKYTELYRWQTPNTPGVNYEKYVPVPDADHTSAKISLNGAALFLLVDTNTTALHPFCKRDSDARDLCDTSQDWVRMHSDCYKIFPPMTWADAVATCQSANADLLAPINGIDLAGVASYLVAGNASLWVDATDTGSIGMFFTSNKKRVTFLPWLNYSSGGVYALNPNNTCVVAVFSNSSFNGYITMPCGVEQPFTCNRPPGTCPLGWYQDGIDCYELHIRPEEKLTWPMAVDYCSRRGSEMAQYAVTTRAKTTLNKELLENDIYLAWIGFSGTGPYFRYIGNDVMHDEIIEYDTTNVTGTNSRCGATDYSPQRTLNLGIYCYTPHNFICATILTNNVIEVVPDSVHCDPGWIYYIDYCYKIETLPLPYDDAQSACKRENATLFVINNENDQSMFSTSPFLTAGLENYWIGVKYDINQNKYVLEESTLQPNVMNFDPKQQYSPVDGPCVYVTTGSLATFIGAWSQDICSAQHKYVCQKAGVQVPITPASSLSSWSPRCGVGWVFSAVTNMCYFISGYTWIPWQDANVNCQSLQGQLLSISGKEEQLVIEVLLKSREYSDVELPLWIGAKDMWDGHGWGWSDNKPFRYMHWGEAEPQYDSDAGNNCGFMPVAKRFEWEARPCTDRLGYICKKPATPEHNEVIPTPATSKNCNDPEALISGASSLQFSSSFTASSYKDELHRPQDCRMLPLNTKLFCQGLEVGKEDCQQSRAWSPANDTQEEWLAIRFPSTVTIEQISLKGEDSPDKYVTKFKLQYKYDDVSPWYWVIDSNRNVKIFDGVTDPDTPTIIVMIGELQAQSIKIWPVEWSFGIAIQIELMGCYEDLCKPEYAMSGPLIADDEQITASSSQTGHGPVNARLQPVQENQQLSYWIPSDSDSNPWIQLDLGQIKLIRGLTIQGDSTVNNYVTKFKLQFSQTDINGFVNYTEQDAVPKEFDGVTSNKLPVTVYLMSSVEARIIRILVTGKNLLAALKFDVLVCSPGCQPEAMLANKTNYKLTASDSQTYHPPERSRLNTPRVGDLSDGWKPIHDNLPDSSYIMVDLGTVLQIKAVATQGSASEGSWVKSYYLAFSIDGQTFRRYGGNVTHFSNFQESTVYNDSVLYNGNFDGSTVVKNELSPPVNARFVQLWPHGFHKSIALRWELYTCPESVDEPIGCYADHAEDPDLPYVPLQDKYASIWPSACVAHCSRQGFFYAGLENQTKCSCGNDYGLYGPSETCLTLCNDPYSNYVCGGPSANLIYNTGLGPTSMVCGPGWLPFRASCYQLVYIQLSWSDAVSTCDNMGGYLVDIADQEENFFVTSLLDDYLNTSWIGLNDQKTSATFEWSTGKEVKYTSWGVHQPMLNKGAHSVTIFKDGSWSTALNDNSYVSVCESHKTPSNKPLDQRQDPGCPQGWFAYGDKCIQLNRLKNTWHDAKSLCELDGSTLLHVNFSQENAFLSTLLVRQDDNYWIDVWDKNSSGLYQHDAGNSDVYFTNWGISKPDSTGRCVNVGSGPQAGLWFNDPCELKSRFICEQPLNVSMPPTLQPPATTPQPSVLCSSGWLSFGDSWCYQINGNSTTPNLSWHEASQDCQQKGANLASFHSDVTFNALTLKLRNLGSNSVNFWIGLNNLDQSSGFKWTDASIMNFVRWGDGQPRLNQVDDLCGEILMASGKIGLQTCSQLKGWICGAPKGKALVVVTPVVYPKPEAGAGACQTIADTWLKYKGYCYHVSDGQGGADGALTWRESRQWCDKHSGDLASINSLEENLFLQGLLTYGIRSESVWIGLNELDRESGYSWSDGSPLGSWVLNWNVNEPNDENGYEACGEILVRNGKWNDQHCAKRQGFICKQPVPGTNITRPIPVKRPDGNCPPKFFKFGQKCFRVMGLGKGFNKLSWSDAYTACRNMKVAGSVNYTVDLASVASQVENAFIMTLLVNDREPVWVGLRRRSNGNFMWSDNEDLTFEGWNKGEPNMAPGDESCVYMFGSSNAAGKWNDVSCNEPAAYVCQGYTDPNLPAIFIPPSPNCDLKHGYGVRYGTSCLKANNISYSISEAQMSCSMDGAKLMYVLDAYDMAQIMVLTQGFPGGVWTGLRDQQSPGHYTWDSGYPVTYTRWVHHQPIDLPGWGCIFINNDGLFSNGPCSDLKPFMCRYDDAPPTVPTIPPGGNCANSDFTMQGNACYLLVLNQTFSYNMAASDCLNRGATLASIHDSSLQLNLTDNQVIWIGLKESIHEGFSWEDGSPLEFTQWASGQPAWSGKAEVEEGCVTTTKYGNWMNRLCEDKYGYLCQAPKVFVTNQVTLPPVSVTQSGLTVVTTTAATAASTPPVPITTPQTPSPSKTTLGPSNIGSTIAPPTTLGGQASGSSGISGGAVAGIVLGVLAAVIIVVIVAVITARRHNVFKSSFLRHEASKVKNFENSLYEATHKDTLTKLDDEGDTVNIVGLESRGHNFSVSYTARDHTHFVSHRDDIQTPYVNFEDDHTA